MDGRGDGSLIVKRRLTQAGYAALLLLGLLHGMRMTVRADFLQPRREIILDWDCQQIVEALERRPRLADTLVWWTGRWSHSIPYYRPITSFLFWLELKAFGRQGLAGFTLVLYGSHLLVLALALGFLSDLVGGGKGVLAVALFAAHANHLFRLPTGIDALSYWKDCCDLWCAAAYLGCLWCFLRFLRQQRRGWLALSPLLFLTALGIKEMAYTTPLLLALLLWHQRGLGSHWRVLIPFFLVAGGALIVRQWALWGRPSGLLVGGSWWGRLVLNVGSYHLFHALYGDALPLGITALGAAAWLGVGRKRWKPAAVLAALAVLALVATARRLGVPPAEVLWGLFLPATWGRIANAAAFALLVWWFLRDRHPDQVFAYGWVVITYLPLNLIPAAEHALYLVALGWSLWLAHAAWQVTPLLERGLALVKRGSPAEIRAEAE